MRDLADVASEEAVQLRAESQARASEARNAAVQAAAAESRALLLQYAIEAQRGAAGVDKEEEEEGMGSQRLLSLSEESRRVEGVGGVGLEDDGGGRKLEIAGSVTCLHCVM